MTFIQISTYHKYKSLRGLRVEHDISLSIHSSALGSCPHFENTEIFKDGVYNRVIGTHVSATPSRTLH